MNSLLDETTAQLKELESQMQAAELELREIISVAEQVSEEYTQLMNWAELYDNCSFEAKKMIVPLWHNKDKSENPCGATG